MKLVFAPRARQDLIEISDYIARDNKTRAESFIHEIEIQCRRLPDNPLAWPEYERRQGIRRMVFGRYLIFYRVQSGTIAILRIVAGVRDLRRLRLR